MDRDKFHASGNGDECVTQYIGLICHSRETEGLDCGQTITNAIILYDSMRADCLVKVVERDLDDT